MLELVLLIIFKQSGNVLAKLSLVFLDTQNIICPLLNNGIDDLGLFPNSIYGTIAAFNVE